MSRRDGSGKLIRVAKVLCQTIVFFQPTLEKYATDKPALTAALNAALAACSLLHDELVDQFVIQGD